MQFAAKAHKGCRRESALRVTLAQRRSISILGRGPSILTVFESIDARRNDSEECSYTLPRQGRFYRSSQGPKAFSAFDIDRESRPPYPDQQTLARGVTASSKRISSSKRRLA